MGNKSRKGLAPRKGDGLHPRIFSARGRLAVLSAALLLEILFAASILVWTRTNFLAEVVSNVLVTEANGDRSLIGLEPLKTSSLLTQAAQEKADDMAQRGYFAHVSPDGATPWYWLNKVGYKFSAAGENLAVNFVDSTDVEIAWMNSPDHRDNILNPKYTEIGIATAHASYNGRDTVFVVEYFGLPSAAASAPQLAHVSPSASQQKYVSVQSAQTVEGAAAVKRSPPPAPAKPQAEQPQPKQSAFWSFLQSVLRSGIVSALVSPRQTVDVVYYLLMALVIASLVWAAATEMRLQRAAPLLSGFLIIAILIGVVYVNYMVATVSQIL